MSYKSEPIHSITIYEETPSSFIKPVYSGDVKSVTVIPVTKEGKWIINKSIYLSGHNNASPYKLIVSSELYTPQRLKQLLSMDEVEIYSLVYNRWMRYYYLLIPAEVIGVNDNLYTAKYPEELARIRKKVKMIRDLAREYLIHRQGVLYGIRDLKITGKNSLYLTYRGDLVNVRAGVLPYTYIKGKLHIFLGVTIHKQLSDFGGGCRNGKLEKPITCIRREVIEEAGEVNGRLMLDSIEDNYGTAVFQGRVNSDQNIMHIVLTRIDHHEVVPHIANDEIIDTKTIRYDTLSKYNSNDFHPPVRAFFEYIFNDNPIVGRDTGIIHDTGYPLIDPSYTYNASPCNNYPVTIGYSPRITMIPRSLF